ncbi:MAG: hypothetical protein JNJ83_11815 [Verrucomicrobiaceae bacterium]|nr:hypothetical protein [Verrucomicrobiaceae bacterium]
MKKLRILAAIGGALVLVGTGVTAWLIHEMNESIGTNTWRRDGPPSETDMIRLLGSDYPRSITRVVEDGVSSRFNGDGEELIIFCFPASDLPRMVKLLSDDRDWSPGLPNGPNWRHQIDSRCPADLQIIPTASSADFIHVQIDNWRWTIIDKNRGISYRVIIRT